MLKILKRQFLRVIFNFGCGKAAKTINIDSSCDMEQSAGERNKTIVSEGESAKASKTDKNFEKFNCDQRNCTNSSKKCLTQHMWIKHCPSAVFRC